jgi:hypothetical protein
MHMIPNLAIGLDYVPNLVAQNVAFGYYFKRKFDRFVSTRLGGIFGASVLAKGTRSRETCVIRKLSGSHYPSHEPGQAPNDPYGALRAAEGQSRLKWRRRRHRCRWSVASIGAFARDGYAHSNRSLNLVRMRERVSRAASTRRSTAGRTVTAHRSVGRNS